MAFTPERRAVTKLENEKAERERQERKRKQGSGYQPNRHTKQLIDKLRRERDGQWK